MTALDIPGCMPSSTRTKWIVSRSGKPKLRRPVACCVQTVMGSIILEEFLKCEGIRHERTIPRTPEQNGVAERMNRNRTLVETAFNAERFKASSKILGRGYVHCCIHTKQEPSESSEEQPFEAWTSHKPTVGYLRMFEET
jgi:hypothetical protein